MPGGIDVARTAEQLGYRSFWIAEANGTEAFSLLGAVGAAAPSLDLGTGVLALQLRTPPLVAMAAATLQALHPDREIIIGVGISSPVVVGRWHGAPYLAKRPLAQTREYVTLLRECLSGESVSFQGDFYEISRFRLGVRLGERRPKIVIGALNEGMLQLAGEVADGVLLNYLPASHVPWSVEQVRKGGDATIYAYVHAGVVADRADGIDAARATCSRTPSSTAYAKASPWPATATRSPRSGSDTRRAIVRAPSARCPTGWSTASTSWATPTRSATPCGPTSTRASRCRC